MLRFFSCILVLLTISFDAGARDIKYPNLNGLGDSTLGLAVLKLALNKSGEDYQVVLDKRKATPNRVISMLETGQVDIIDGGYTPNIGDKLTTLYLPLDMGLSGWRVFAIRKETSQRLSKVRTIDDLKSFSFGQGQGWYDANILETAGLTVIKAPKLDSLIGMLQKKRFDILPLGANAAYKLIELFGNNSESLVVDDAITLIYPFGRFFYLRKSDKELKLAVKKGMEIALSDGSLLSLLQSHPFSRDSFRRANLHDRIQIRINTPGLSEGFKSIDPKWWFVP